MRMHNTLVHAVGQGTKWPGPKKEGSLGLGPPKHDFWALAPGFPGPEHAQECCACTRDLVYTQEILLCTHKTSFAHKQDRVRKLYLKLQEQIT